MGARFFFPSPAPARNQDRAFQCCRGFALSGIQFVKESHDGERGLLGENILSDDGRFGKFPSTK